MVVTLDRRLTPARPDIAAEHLRGQVEAARFVAGEAREVAAGQAPVRRAPARTAALETEALRGEGVTVYDKSDDGWAWCQLARDGYVGWLPAAALRQPGPAPTHRVAPLRTLVFPGPEIKLPPVDALPMGAEVALGRAEGALVEIAGAGFVPSRHLVPLETTEADPVTVAERFLGVPYLWGGKTSLGIDCSGLMQVAFAACGIALPRDSDMQDAACRARIEGGAARALRGDLVFWKGHVALVRDGETLIHANAHHMAVAIEPIEAAVARIAASGSAVLAVKRPSAR